MRKYAVLAMLMAFIVAFTTGCGLIVKDEEVDAQTVIIEVAGTTITKAEVEEATESQLDYTEYMYSYYGISYDRTDADHIASAQEAAIETLIQQAVIEQKIVEYGVDQLTDEELAAITQSVDDTYDSYLSAVQSYYFSDTELTGDELTAAVEAKLLELGYSSKDEMMESEKLSAAEDKLKEEVVKDVAITEDEIQTAYDDGVANAISDYEYDLTEYATDVSNSGIIYYVPDGYRYVKNLLVMLSDEAQTEIDTLTSDISDDEDSLDATITAIDELNADDTSDYTDEQLETWQKSLDELTAQSETMSAEIEDMTAQLDEVTEAAYAAIQPTVDEVLAKLEAGEEFDALIEEYGEDTGMQSEPYKTTGYLICDGMTTYVDEFTEAAMALKKVGDISDPFRTDYGIHIVQYTSDVEAGQVDISEIHDDIEAELLADAQDTLYNDTIAQWVTDANAKTYTNRLD